ncbi:hypothetical protein B0H16DRAFT_1241322, partial [Mycena metata]
REGRMARIREVCLFLIAHHSDPNEKPKGQNHSALGVACISRSWELIRALLLHGARSLGHTRYFPDEADKTRFKSLVSELAKSARPARICPCGSDRTLRECHQNFQPYPIHFICLCGSRKVYGACCAKKSDMSWSEKWNEKKGWLDFARTVARPARAAHHDLDESGRVNKPNETILKVLIDEHRIDPAYAATCKKTDMAPSPAAACAIPKQQWMKLMETWNDTVNAYIASGVDHRAPESIEAAAKIGYAGGPLWCKCERERCSKMESRDAEAFPRCSGCKTAVYCSHNCQKSAWKAHKTVCRAGDVKAQLLPSQEA